MTERDYVIITAITNVSATIRVFRDVFISDAPEIEKKRLLAARALADLEADLRALDPELELDKSEVT